MPCFLIQSGMILNEQSYAHRVFADARLRLYEE